ncbi:MAG: beta-lactamase family protein [Acidobacteriia bacterium]|nr:beta-lactamase family protein [Terriglobia bacterium]
MSGLHLERRAFLTLGAATFIARQSLSAAPPDDALDQFIARYMQAMNSPGMTLALARRDGAPRVATFGYSNLESREAVTPDHLFQVGSISKSFVALTCLQLHDEGKLDLDRPILDYLPWLPIVAKQGTITVHHLLTHTSGLPNALGFLMSDPGARYVQAYRPGEHFHYCNLGYCILGHLIASIDQRPWSESVRKRVLEPIGMKASSAVIGGDTQPRMARSYLPKFDDRLNPRLGDLAPIGYLIFDNAAGSVTATPGDMTLYMRMLMNGGAGVISKESFAKFTKPYIEADELGPTSKYGYGIGVDHLDGHLILRHTGGMASFMSSITVDLDSGVAAFASINAQQGYRPVPATEFAVRLMNAEKQSKPGPAPPELNDPRQVKSASDFAGLFQTPAGRKLQVVAEGSALSILDADRKIPLEQLGANSFLADEYSWRRFPLLFGRSNGKVVELSHGPDWYVNEKYTGPKDFPAPKHYEAFVGHYRSDSPWFRSTRIVLRKGKLWAGGTAPLEPIGEATFRLGSESFSPDVVEFLYVASGKALLLKTNGSDHWRVETP